MADRPTLNTSGINILSTLNAVRQLDLADAQKQNIQSEIAHRKSLEESNNALYQFKVKEEARKDTEFQQKTRKDNMELLGKSFAYLSTIDDPAVLEKSLEDFNGTMSNLNKKDPMQGLGPEAVIPVTALRNTDGTFNHTATKEWLKSADRALRSIETPHENDQVKLPVFNKFYDSTKPYSATNSPVLEIEAVMKNGKPTPIINTAFDETKPESVTNFKYIVKPLVSEADKLNVDIQSNKARLEETKATRQLMQGNRDREFGLSVEKENRVTDSQLANHYTQITLNKDNPALAGEVEVFNNNSRGFEVFAKTDQSRYIPFTDQKVTDAIEWKPIPTPSVTLPDASGKLVTTQVPAYRVAEVQKKYNLPSIEKAIEFIIKTDKEVAAARSKGVKK